jgi:3-oxoacyl-[acyl-carrier-protein] synthase II
MSRDAWITGLAAVTALSSDFETFADRLFAGQSGIRHVDLLGRWGESPCAVGIVDDVPRPDGWSPESFQPLNRLDRFASSCTVRALQDAALWEDRQQLRVGVVLGLGAERFHVWEIEKAHGSGCVYDPQQEPQPTLRRIQQHLGLTGPGMTVAAACASGNYALGIARGWVTSGLVDVCLAGSFDVVTGLAFVGFNNLRALSRYSGPPEAASRPFDADRDGFVMSEGGAMFVVESARHARVRGAKAYGALAGFGASSDASHMIIPSQDPQPASQAMRRALADAELQPHEVDYLNAHATSTPVGDRAEVNALRLVYGDALSSLPVSATKSITGHALSGAASIEALACLTALRRQMLPPTLNLEDPDPECDLNHVAQKSRAHRVQVAASNSFGFGGSNTCLVLRKAA